MKEYIAPTIDFYTVKSEAVASDALTKGSTADPESPWFPGGW